MLHTRLYIKCSYVSGYWRDICVMYVFVYMMISCGHFCFISLQHLNNKLVAIPYLFVRVNHLVCMLIVREYGMQHYGQLVIYNVIWL